MDRRLREKPQFRLALSGAALLALAGSRGLAQPPASCAPPPPCATAPAPSVTVPSPGTADTGIGTAPSTLGQDMTGATASAAPGGGEGVAGGRESVNLIGNLLGAGRSVSYFINRTQGAFFVNTLGSTNIINPKVADDNSPLPQDRVSFRYNYFNNSQSVTGVSSAPPVFSESLGAFVQPTTTKNYNVNLYTFQFEKTFLDDQFSLEFRVPFFTGLASHLNINAGTVTGIGPAVDLNGQPIGILQNGRIVTLPNSNATPLQALQVNSTPGNTLGHSDTEWGDLSLILKGLAYRSDWLALSGGVAVTFPTAEDTHVTVTDYLGNPQFNNLQIQRVRDFHVNNEIWGLTPFVAFLATPSDRFFTQGFLAVDVPLNTEKVTFSETTPISLPGTTLATGPGIVNPPINVTDHLREQTLLQADIGAGYWLVRNCDGFLSGIAPTLELHYTTTLNNADIINLPRDGSGVLAPTSTPNTVVETSAPGPQVGNLRNRVDLLDMTVGTTFEIANQATIATAFAFPLLGGDNRTFDWEFLLQVNIYFGGPRSSRTPPIY